jgi:xanthine dehydrogenase molybdenum-binding subunit
MITFDFAYYQPKTSQEAVQLFKALTSEGKQVFYYGGGTEFISRARKNEITADAVIDLKEIPELCELKNEGERITIGAAATLTDVVEATFFPLLSDVARTIATRTERNKITVGGNLASHLYYKEAVLPFLLADSELHIAGETGIRKTNVNGAKIKKGEIITQITTDSVFSQYPHKNSKKTKQSRVNYPVVSVASMHVNGAIRIAFSGLCTTPFRSVEMETALNDPSASIQERIEHAIDYIQDPVLDDMYASSGYRKFLVEHELKQILEEVSE